MPEDKNYEEIDGDIKPLYEGINGPVTPEGAPLDKAVNEHWLFSDDTPSDVFEEHIPEDLTQPDQTKAAGRIATAEVVDNTELNEGYRKMWANEPPSADNRVLYDPQHSTKKSVPAIDERLLIDQPLGPTSVSSRRRGRRTKAQRRARATEAEQRRQSGYVD